MKRFSILSFSLIILLILLFVLIRSTEEVVSVRLVSERTDVTYTDDESVRIFEEAIRTTRKVPGTVDVGPPVYRITVTYADSKVVGYSLYINIETKDGFLIKESDSGRMLDLKDKSVKELAKYTSNPCR